MGKTGEKLHESSCFCTGDSRTFSTAKGGLFVFAALQPADRQARMGMAANVIESALSMTLPTATYAKGAARKSRKSFCISITLIMHTTTADATFLLPFRLTMSIIMRTLTAIYAIRYDKTK